MYKKIICFIVAVCFSFTVTGCATIVSGTSQRLPVASMPSGAIITVGTQKQMSPATFLLDKHQEYVIRVEKEGYQTVEIPLRKGLSGWIFGNILLFPWIGTVIGILVDIATGSAVKFSPSPLEVNLIKQEFGSYKLKGKTILFVKLIEKGEQLK